MTRAIIFGGRDATDARFAFDRLDHIHAETPITLVIEGGQRTRNEEGRVVGGIDYFANRWALSRGIPCETVYAEWKKYGKPAGPIRNGRMLREKKPDVAIGFPGGAGTANMIEQARAAGVKVIEVGGATDDH